MLTMFFVWIVAPGAAGALQDEASNVSVIVVTTQAQALELRDRIGAGESFDLLAMRHSVGRSAGDGGYIGAVSARDLRPELARPLDRLQPGEVSPVTAVGPEFLLVRRFTQPENRWRFRYNAGLQALQQGRYPEALRALSEAVEMARAFGDSDSRFARTLLSLSQLHFQERSYADAASLAEQSRDILDELLRPEHAVRIAALEHLAAIRQEQEMYVEAERLYQRILSLRWKGGGGESAGVMDVLDALAAVLSASYVGDAELSEVFRRFEETLSRSRIRQDLYAAISDGLLRFELVKEAEAVMQRAVLVFPESRQTRFAQAEMYAKAVRYERALAAFEAADRLPGDVSGDADRQQRSLIHGRIGRMNTLLIRFDDALRAYRTSLELNPHNFESRIALGDLYFLRHQLDEALAEYTTVIAADPQNARAFHGLAEATLQLGRFSEAASAAERALKLNPANRETAYIRAIALLRDGRRQQGQQALGEYQRAEAESLAAQRRRRAVSELRRNATAKLAEGRPEEAIPLIRRALDTAPDDGTAARLHLFLGLVQSRTTRHREAIETFRTAIRLRSDDFLIHRNLALEYQRSGDSRADRERLLYVRKYDAALRVRLN